MKNPIAWLEIPTKDINRASDFYNYIFNWKIQAMDIGELKMAIFPGDNNGKGGWGALVQHEKAYAVSENNQGALPYFSTDDIDKTLQKIQEAGGEILLPKTMISEENGYMALFRDSEGNRMALHSKND